MPTHKSGNAADFLERQCALVTSRRRLPKFADVLIVGEPASRLLGAMLRLMFGYDLSVRTAASLGRVLEATAERMPDLIFLDHSETAARVSALDAMPIIRRCGYMGTILVTALSPDQTTTRELLAAGASEVIDREELDSTRIAEALLRTHVPENVAAE